MSRFLRWFIVFLLACLVIGALAKRARSADRAHQRSHQQSHSGHAVPRSHVQPHYGTPQERHHPGRGHPYTYEHRGRYYRPYGYYGFPYGYRYDPCIVWVPGRRVLYGYEWRLIPGQFVDVCASPYPPWW